MIHFTEGERVFPVNRVRDPEGIKTLVLIHGNPPPAVGIGSLGGRDLEGQVPDGSLPSLVLQGIKRGNLMAVVEQARQIRSGDFFESVDFLGLSLVDTEFNRNRILGIAVDVHLDAIVDPEGKIGDAGEFPLFHGGRGNLTEGPDTVVGAEVLNDHAPGG